MMRSGMTLYSQSDFVAGGKIDQRFGVAHMLDASALGVEVDTNCYAVLNMGCTIRWAIYPGPPSAPSNAWSARRTG